MREDGDDNKDVMTVIDDNFPRDQYPVHPDALSIHSRNKQVTSGRIVSPGSS